MAQRLKILTVSFVILALCLALMVAQVQQVRADSSVFINEIHYDNANTDVGEAVEIAGPAGTDLTGWSIVLYNGSNSLVYDTDALSGVIADQQGGYGTVVLTYPSNGIQNGSPDGIALVDATNTVVQFLSYEGTITAADGPAIGMLSTDIGVSENGSGAVGNSLQLIGSGTTDADFTWAGEQANTFGAVNTGQTFSGGPAPDPVLVINEIDYDQPSTDTAEFVEIKNVGTVSADLSEFTLELVNGTGGGAAVYQSYVLPSVTLAVGDYFVVCGDAANVANCDLDVSPDSNLVQNGAPDGAGLLHNGTLVDAVSYEGDTGAPYTEGSGAGLEDNPAVENAGISRFPDGVDTNQNNADFSLRCSTPGAANLAESSNCVAPNTDLVINEIDYDQPGTDAAEFVEIFNHGPVATDLTGWTLDLVNGNGGTVYLSIDLSSYTLAAGGYFVVCANTATVANCNLDVSPDTNLIQNGAPDAVALSFNGTLIDAVSYEGDTAAPYTEGSGAGLADNGLDGSISRCPNGVDTNQNNVDFTFTDSSTPGAENSCTPPPLPEACGDPFTPIYAVQGSGLASPLVGSEVAIEGLVVGDFQNNASLDNGDFNGFHVQDPTGDANVATSDGIFVYAPGGIDVAVGDAVRVRGAVSEYNGLTEISAAQIWVCSTGNALPAAAQLSLPVTNLDNFEAYEGMLVTFPQALVISEYFNYDRFGEIVLTSERHQTPTAEFEPGPDSIAAATAFLLDKITLDDGRSVQNPDPALHPNGGIFDLSNLFRGGDTVANVTGILDYSFGLYRIQPTQGADYTNTNPRTAQPEEVGGNLKVVSMNTLNYFSTIDQGTSYWICGPSQNMECRGADTPEEFLRQRGKLIAAISAMDADVIGLLEIENNINDAAVQNLVDALNTALGAGTYDSVHTGVIGTDAIKVALIYQPASVSLVGNYAILDSSVDPRFVDTKNRPALAQSFMDRSTGGIFTVAVNHLKSKGSDCNDLGDPDLGDGAGNCNLTRTLAAQALVDWLATDPTASGDADFLIVGDLNSYDKEDPIDAIQAGPDDVLGTADDYTDLAFQFQGEYAYSYVFDGQIGYLDYGLASANLLGQVTGVADWHVNADEPDLIDYDMSFKLPAQDALYAPDAYRYSDHDPVVIGLEVCDAIAPTADVSLSTETLWPVNHKYVTVVATVTALDNFDPAPTVTLVSVTSNEADDGLGDGDTPNDIVIVDNFTIQLRAERSGTGTDRVYTLIYRVTDACGNSTLVSATVTVPHNN
ncbi:MAG TPA: hypothetical protein DEH25_01720 [Chloroflexi bacterium]|nr:hypothetical protein [Chloroflexota bacterium]